MPRSDANLSDRLKSVLPYVGVGAAVALAVIVVWTSASPPATEEQEGFHLACKACGDSFLIDRDEAADYPREAGVGFKCKKCGQFAADVAAKCRACGGYYAPRDDAPECPRCAKGKVATGTAR
jgi:predicted RNA-binding Zn-ribbon protein involved in translation (DUF1610 family)